MTGADLAALLPLIVLSGAVIAVLLAVALRRDHRLSAALSLLGLVLSCAALAPASSVAPRQVTPLMVVDGYALFFMGLLFAAGIAVVLLSYSYFAVQRGRREELYILLLLALLGAAALVSASHFASFFLGLETLSVALFAMIAHPLGRNEPMEAGLKYLVLSGVSSAFLAFGMALIYAELGTMAFREIGALLAGGGEFHEAYLLSGLALIVVGVGFKLSLVPFHLWTPDVYQGAPAPVTAFLSTVSKGAVFALLLRYFVEAGIQPSGSVLLMLGVIAVLSILAGNLLALLQDNVKRILAYSSIAHLGYLLVAFLAGREIAVEAVSYYLVAYFVTTLGAFGVVSLLSSAADAREFEALADYRGLFWRRPWIAGMFTAMLLSLAGIPLTVGFIAKFYAIAAGVDAALWIPVAALVIGSVIGLFYYLRIVAVMYGQEKGLVLHVPAISPAGSLLLAVLTLLLLWLGVYPAALMRVIQAMVLNIV